MIIFGEIFITNIVVMKNFAIRKIVPCIFMLFFAIGASSVFGQNQRSGVRGGAPQIDFVQAGPLNLNGPARAFLIDQDNEDIMYLGISGGGILKTVNKGQSWAQIRGLSHLRISDFTQTPDGTIYAVTASGFENYRGVATVYKSVDGHTFQELETPFRDIENTQVRTYFIESLNNGDLLVGTFSNLYYSDDGGDSWSVHYSSTQCIDGNFSQPSSIAALPNGNAVIATRDKIFHTSNPTESCDLDLVFEYPGTSQRIVLDYCKNDPDYVYALCYVSSGFVNVPVIYQSTDGGLTWDLHRPTFASQFQAGNYSAFQMGVYSLALTVDPVNCNTVYAGGNEIFRVSSGWVKLLEEAISLPNGTEAFHATFNLTFAPGNDKKLYVSGENGLFVIDLATEDNPITSLNAGSLNSVVKALDVDKNGRFIGSTYSAGAFLVDPQKPSHAGRTATPLIDIEGFSQSVSNLSGDILVSRHSNDVYLAREGKATRPFFPFPNIYDYSFSHSNGNIQTLFEYWESDRDTLSIDSITFVADTVLQNVRVLQSHTQVVEGTLAPPQPAARLIPGTISFIHRNGNDTIIVDDYRENGKLYNSADEEVGTIDYQSKEYTVEFSYSPVDNSVLQAKYPFRLLDGDSLFLKSSTRSYPLNIQLTTNLNPGDSLRVQDPYSSVFAIFYNRGIVLSKEVLRKGVPDYPDDYIDLDSLTGMPQGGFNSSMVFSRDGNHLFFSGTQGTYRISGIKDVTPGVANSQELNAILNVTRIGSWNLIDMQINPRKEDEMLGVGGGSNSEILEITGILPGQTINSRSLSQSNSFEELPTCVSYDILNGNRVLVGTTRGLYITDRLAGGNTQWTLNGGETDFMYITDIDQIRHEGASEELYGNFYLATWGMGVLTDGRIGTFVENREVNNLFDKESARSLIIFPNPANQQVQIALSYSESAVPSEVTIYDISGKIVYQTHGVEIGNRNAPGVLDVTGFKQGVYIVQVRTQDQMLTEKLIISK